MLTGLGIILRLELDDKLFVNRSHKPGSELKDAIMGTDATRAWHQWRERKKFIASLRSSGPDAVIAFPNESAVFQQVFGKIQEEEQSITVQYTRPLNELAAWRRGQPTQETKEKPCLSLPCMTNPELC